MIDICIAMFQIYPQWLTLIPASLYDPTCKLGWHSWNYYAVNGEWK